METPIRIGHIDLSFHAAAARAVEDVVVKHGHVIERSAAPHEEAFRMLGAGEIDLLCAAWLPDSHSVYLTPLLDDVTQLTILYHPYCIWGVPDFVPETDVAEIADLVKPSVAGKMERLLQGINPGAGISRFSNSMISEYGLDELGYHFEPGTEEDCFGRFIDAHAEGRWVVIPLWHPQWLHNRYDIRALHEPKGLLGGQDNATLILRNDAKDRLGQEPIQELSTLTLGNAKVSALDDQLQRSKGKDETT